MAKNPFVDMITPNSADKQLDESTTIIATAPLTAAEFAAASQQSQQSQQQYRPDNYNPFSDSRTYLFGTDSARDEDNGDDGEEDEESVVRARREALAALDPYNANAYKEHFKSLKVPKKQESQEDLLEKAVLPFFPSKEISTQAMAFEEPDESLAIIAVRTPPTSRRQQQKLQRESVRSSIYSTPKAQIERRPISRDMTYLSNNLQEDIVPQISISLATPSPPPSSSSSSNKRHHRRGSSLANANPALLTTSFTPSPLSISSPLDEEFDRLEANKNKKDKSNRSTTIYTTLFQRISSFGSFSGSKATADDDELVDHIGAEMKKDLTASSFKPVSASWSLKRNTFGASSGGASSSSSLSDLTIQQQTSQASRFGILGRKSNKGSRSNKKSRKHGVAAVMSSLDPWDSCDDMLLQGTDDEDLYDDDGSALSVDRRDRFLKGRMGGRRRSNDDATTRVDNVQGIITRLGKGAKAGVEDWVMHPRTAAIHGTIHKAHHDDVVPVPVLALQHQDKTDPVPSSASEYMTISLASPPMTVFSSHALGGGNNAASTSLSRVGPLDSSFYHIKKGASNFLGNLGSNSLQNDAKGQAKKYQDQDEDERMHQMMDGDHEGGEQDLVINYCANNIDDGDSDLAFNHSHVDQRSSSMTFGPVTTRKAVSPPPLAIFSSFSSIRDLIHSATGLSRSSTVPIGGSDGTMGKISPPSSSPTAYLRRSQSTTGGFGGYSEVQQGYSSSSTTTGTDGGRPSFSPVSRRKNTPVMVPTIIVPKHVPGSGATAALSATPLSFSPPPLTSTSNSSSSTTAAVLTCSDEDSTDVLLMVTSSTSSPTRTFHRLGSSTSLAVPAKAATAANSTQLPSSLAASAMAAAQRARAAYSLSNSSPASYSSASLSRSNTSVSVDSMTGPLTGNDYIGQFERSRSHARDFGTVEHEGGLFGLMNRINNASSFSKSSSNNSGSLNSLATTVQQHHLHQHGSAVYHPTTAMSSTTTLPVDDDADSHGRHCAEYATGVGAGDIEKVVNTNQSHDGFGFGFLYHPTSLSTSSLPNDSSNSGSIPQARRTRQPSTDSNISEKLMHLPDPSPFEGMCTCRGLVNITSMFLILCGLILMILGYPIASSLKKDRLAAEAAAADAASAANAALSQVRFAIDSQHQQQAGGGGGAGLGLMGPLSKTATSTVVRSAMLVDPDTPQDKLTTVARDGKLWDLAFSDEFNQDGRGFAPGQDPHWEAMNLPPSKAMGTLENYSSDQVTTRNGHLEIILQRDTVHLTGAKSQKRDGSSGGDWKYTSGMLQSWNKMCFQGGILEVFILGNLARHGYPASMDGVWPFSSSSTQCDPATTSIPSNSTTASSSLIQRLNGCSSDAETSLGRMSRGAPEMTLLETHYGVQMDTAAVEAQKRAIQILQQAPPKVLQRREYRSLKRHQEEPVMDQGVSGAGIKGETVVLQKQRLGGSRVIVDAALEGTRIGGSGGGSVSRHGIAISSVRLASSSSSSSSTSNGSNNSSMVVSVETSTPQWIQPLDSRFFSPSSSLDNLHSMDKEEFVQVGLEYWPGTLNSTTTPKVDSDAYIQFSLNNIRHPPLLSNSHSLLHSQSHQLSPPTPTTTTATSSPNRDEDWYRNAKFLPENTQIPQEPMSIVVGLGLLQDELLLDPELAFPAVMKIDYIRLYQPRQQRNGGKAGGMSCDPVDHPTAAYIRTHPRAYSDPGVNTWADAGYTA
ncbi:hypothetical protein BGZ96_010908 [Linnemannia gamsii]|uniref:Glycoside hydrolase family 16 protein n=1 Tax=Linnemannia gamsii TaxID=64522 RepID=A0ABQ7JU24_9FUNG|nr:hypothetical protein BGZ96_010908 [Linnemannia gamsii]